MGDSTDDPNTQFYASVAGNPNSSMVMSSNTTLDLSAPGLGNVLFGSLADVAGSPTGHQVLLGGNTLVTGLDGTSTEFSGVISGSGGSLMKLGAGMFTLAGANTYTGATTISGGTLQLGDGTSGHDGTLATSGITNNAALVYNVFSGQAANYAISGTGTLTKIGGGMLTMTGGNTYTGATAINAGTLQLGANGVLAAASSVTVSSGGTLALVGNAQLASNSITILPGGMFNVTAASPVFSLAAGQTLTAGRSGSPATDIQGSVTLNGGVLNIGNGVGTIATLTAPTGTFTLSGGTVNFDATNVSTTSGGTNDLIKVANLALTGPTALSINPVNLALGSGLYNLFDLTGALSGGTSNLNLQLQNITTVAARQSFSLVTTSSAVELQVINNAAHLTWTGSNSAAWDVITTKNWNNGGSADFFYNNDFVTFDDTAKTGSVTLVGNLMPASMTFNNNALNYTLSGSGSIGGHGDGLTMTGSGMVILANSNGNTYAGATTLNGGVLVLGNANSVQNSTVSVNVNDGLTFSPGIGTFNLGGLSGPGAFALSDTAGGAASLNVGSNGASTTYSGLISGNGGLTKSGSGTLTLSSTNTYSGTTVINTGVVQLANAYALQNSTVALNADNGLLFSPAIGTFNVGGLSGANALSLLDTAASPVTLSVGGNGQSTSYSGALTGAGSLVKTGTGELSLSGTGIQYTGNTTVTNGTLQFFNASIFSNGDVPANKFNVASGGVLEFYTDSSGTAADTANQVLGAMNGGGSTFTGSGVFRKTGNGILASGQGVTGETTMTFAMSSGGLIDIQNGTLRNGGWQNTSWTTTTGTTTTTNMAGMNIAANGTFDVWDGNPVYIDALTGAGSLTKGQGSGSVTLNVGVAGGSGTFSGVIQNPQTGYEGNDITGSSIALVKAGSGLQVLTGSNTYTGPTSVTGGTLQVG
ncbi:MAG: autotransporter-associated beta strand repeat-containing protein, partial [Thermoguttaceae bacterium]